MAMNGLDRLRGWLGSRSLDGILLSRRDNYAWIAGSAKRNQVLQSTETGVGTLLVTADSVDLLADTIDGQRLWEEETAIPTRLVTWPWYQDTQDTQSFLRQHLAGRRIVSDTGLLDTANVQQDLVDLRLQLDEPDQVSYRSIGLQCAGVVESVCREARPGQTERQIAVAVQARCLQQGISPNCVLVGGDERIFRYRHPMPTDKVIDKSLMVVLGGEKNGLNISLTRFVYFAAPTAAYLQKFRKTQTIFAQMQALTTAGRTYQDFFGRVIQLYAEAGYAGEWVLHHQGGPTGYACREKIITPATDGMIAVDQAFAWNPTITGTKCEETTLLTTKGLEILTRTPDWPVTIIQTDIGDVSVADILVRT